MATIEPLGVRSPAEEWSGRALVPIFVIASFLGSGLLFMVQPMVARMLLPLAGGTPSLWNTSMVFFQLALLAGYAYAHFSTRHLGLRLHPVVQVALLAVPLLVLPIAVSDSWRLPTDQSPAVWVFVVLALVVGLPFFVLSTSSPTLQRWFAATGHSSADNPYFLYAAGNAGSVLALLAYPLVVEPLLSLGAQTRLWTALYVLFLGISALAAWMTRRDGLLNRPIAETDDSPSIEPARRARWVLWSFVPSALMLGVTRHIATDIASFPLLWIVPLLLYLTTFIIAFGRTSSRRTELAAVAVRFGVIPLVVSFVVSFGGLALQITLHLTWFFFAALLGHSRLSDDRPAPARLTEFYLWVSVGGVAGGAFAALAAPVVFSTVLEYPISIALALVLVGPIMKGVAVPARLTGSVVAVVLALAWLARAQRLHAVAMILVLFATVNAAATFRRSAPYAAVVAFSLLVALVVQPSGLLAQERSFFGVYRVQETGGARELTSGTTNHGTQFLPGSDREFLPTSYYHGEGPLGQIMNSGTTRRDVGIVGLGVGGIAAYGLPGDRYTFYEIDPKVVEIAQNPELFTFLSGSKAFVSTVVGDGRLSLADSTERFDVLVIDAFNSDAIPIHLLTLEAVEAYVGSLNDGGMLAVHISNRHFELEPVLGRIGSELGLDTRIQRYSPTEVESEEGSLASHWMLLAPAAGTLDWTDERWTPARIDGPLWTDDYSDILRVLDL